MPALKDQNTIHPTTMAEVARSERTGGNDGGNQRERMAVCTQDEKVEALEKEDETAEQEGMSEHAANTIEEDSSASKGSMKKRLGRQWHKYCQTLPRHYKGGAMSSDEVDAKRAGHGQNVERRQPEKGSRHPDSHRRAGAAPPLPASLDAEPHTWVRSP